MATRGGEERAIYVISVAAELAGVHPQTLRVYERKGLVNPQRTSGNTRRYSEEDIARLRKIQELTAEGINLAGVIRILELEEALDAMRAGYEELLDAFEQLQQDMRDVVGGRDDMALVPLKDVRRIRRALKVDIIDEAGRRRIFTAPPISET